MPTGDAQTRKPASEAIGVPRRFAVGTLLVIVTMYSVLFAFLTSLGANPVIFGIVTLFFTGVGLGQVVFFKGARPRDASYLSGMLLCPTIVLPGFLAAPFFAPSRMGRQVCIQEIAELLWLMFYGAILGVPLG